MLAHARPDRPANLGVNQRIEFFEDLGVWKHDGGQRQAIERPIGGHNLLTKSLDDCVEYGCTRLLQLTRHCIGIDDHGTKPSEPLGHC